MRTLAAALSTAVLLVLSAMAGSVLAAGDEPTLEARAILPADAYQPGPQSGAFISPNNGVTPPFPGQPIPGFSAVLNAGRGIFGQVFWGMPDNGYGAKGNSGDFLLRMYRIRPDFKTARGGSGTVEIHRSFPCCWFPVNHCIAELFASAHRTRRRILSRSWE